MSFIFYFLQLLKNRFFNREDIKTKIGLDLFERFSQIQRKTPKKLTLRDINVQCIGDSLYNVSFSLQYEQSRRKYDRAYLNFNYCSETFNEMLPELKELLKNNSSEFRKFVDSIFDNLLSKINRIDINTLKTKKDRNQKDISFFF